MPEDTPGHDDKESAEDERVTDLNGGAGFAFPAFDGGEWKSDLHGLTYMNCEVRRNCFNPPLMFTGNAASSPQNGKNIPLMLLLNGSHEGVDFRLPKGDWKILVDGLRLRVNAFGLSIVPDAHNDYHLHPGTCAMLAPF